VALVVTSQPDGELLSVADTRRHLRVFDDSLDDEIVSLIRAARDYCERYSQRTLREAVTRTIKRECWWTDRLCLPWPPLISLTSIQYYDYANVLQTLAGSDYYLLPSTDGGGVIEWASTSTMPGLYARPDAVIVTFVTGYADLSAVPPVAVQAMKTKVTELYGEGEVDAARKCTDRLLSLCDWSGYS